MLFISGSLILVYSVSVEIDGVIDLGPGWNYEYKIIPADKRTIDDEILALHENDDVTTKKTEDYATEIVDIDNPENIYDNPHAVKDDKKINQFAFHVYKQSLKVFDTIKQKVDSSLSHKVDFIARSYDEKFRNFVNETLNHKIKTRLGTQKGVLNTIDTSDRLLRRLVNYLIGEIGKNGVLRNKMAITNVLQKEVDKESDLEYKHICVKFGICLTPNGFNMFLADVITILLKNDDKELKQASDALTEVLKTTDFTKIMDFHIQKKFRNKILDIESWDEDITRACYKIFKNILALKNHPIKVMVQNYEQINSTVVLLEIIDEFDKVLLPNEENLLEWTDIKNSLEEWNAAQRKDILEIMQSLISHIIKKGVDKMSDKKLDSLKQKFTILLS
jgi:hypothetical protein